MSHALHYSASIGCDNLIKNNARFLPRTTTIIIQWNPSITDTIGNQNCPQAQGFRYISGRRGMRNRALRGCVFRALLCCTLAGKANTTNNSANLTASCKLQQRWWTILQKRSNSVGSLSIVAYNWDRESCP